jgi:hypothetical protein
MNWWTKLECRKFPPVAFKESRSCATAFAMLDNPTLRETEGCVGSRQLLLKLKVGRRALERPEVQVPQKIRLYPRTSGPQHYVLSEVSTARSIQLSPFSNASAPSPAMVGYAALYLLIALAVALYNFQECDL